MDPIDVLEIFLQEVGNLGYEIDTKYGVEDHKTEIVLIDGWNYDRKIRHNSTYSNIARDENGTAIGENHSHHYTMTVDLEIRSENELVATQRQNEIQKHFRKYEGNPSGFHDHMMIFKEDGGGLKDPFFEPTSLRIYKIGQTFEMEFVDTDVHESGDEIGEIEEIERNIEAI